MESMAPLTLFLCITSKYGSISLLTATDIKTLSCNISHQTLKKDEFYALLSVADLGVITPLRDGMNTTSMEFVIAQEKTKKSPSVLSEFMGISKNMEEALQVNPWNLGVSFDVTPVFVVVSLTLFTRTSPPRSTKVSSCRKRKRSTDTRSCTKLSLPILRILGQLFS